MTRVRGRHVLLAIACASWVLLAVLLIPVMATAPFAEAFTASCVVAATGAGVGVLAEALA